MPNDIPTTLAVVAWITAVWFGWHMGRVVHEWRCKRLWKRPGSITLTPTDRC